MTNQPPLISGHYYHIYNRGNNRENLFIEERNYHYFFKLYTHYIYPIADTYAYCLMRNHFHLLVGMKPQPQNHYSQAFSNLFSTYTKAINKQYQRTGSLFEKPFKRIHIDSDRYFITLIRYIHQNPQKHQFTDDFRTYPYSSYQTIYQQKNSRIPHHQVINWFGNRQSFATLHKQFEEDEIQHLIEDDYD